MAITIDNKNIHDSEDLNERLMLRHDSQYMARRTRVMFKSRMTDGHQADLTACLGGGRRAYVNVTIARISDGPPHSKRRFSTCVWVGARDVPMLRFIGSPKATASLYRAIASSLETYNVSTHGENVAGLRAMVTMLADKWDVARADCKLDLDRDGTIDDWLKDNLDAIVKS